MNKSEVIQQVKSEALNKIRKIYHPLANNNYDKFGDSGSYSEQRDSMISYIIEELEENLKYIKKYGGIKRP